MQGALRPAARPRGRDPQQPPGSPRQPPVPLAEHGHQGRDQQAPDHGGIEQDPGAQRGGGDFRSVSGPADKAAKAKNKMSAAPVTSRPVRLIPSMTPAWVDPVRSRSSRIRVRMNTS
jgi:hypothetical protein